LVSRGRPASSRLVSTPSGDRADLAAFFQGAGGPVCEQAEHLLPPLVLARGRRPSARHRRAGPPVAEPAPICFSPDPAPPASAVQGSGRGQIIDIDSPPLAQSAVGGRSIQYVSATALGAASAERPPNTGAQDSVASPSGAVASQGLAPERCRLLASGLSDAVVATIQSARAMSTRALYTLKCRSFERWCAARQHDPINCTLGVILEFLQQLFDEGKVASTLKVYMAAISACHAGINGSSPGSHPLASRFMAGVRRLRVPERHLIPSWDLLVVLRALTGPPFEPLETVDIKFV